MSPDWINTILLLLFIPWALRIQSKVSRIEGYLNRRHEDRKHEEE